MLLCNSPVGALRAYTSNTYSRTNTPSGYYSYDIHIQTCIDWQQPPQEYLVARFRVIVVSPRRGRRRRRRNSRETLPTKTAAAYSVGSWSTTTTVHLEDTSRLGVCETDITLVHKFKPAV